MPKVSRKSLWRFQKLPELARVHYALFCQASAAHECIRRRDAAFCQTTVDTSWTYILRRLCPHRTVVGYSSLVACSCCGGGGGCGSCTSCCDVGTSSSGTATPLTVLDLSRPSSSTVTVSTPPSTTLRAQPDNRRHQTPPHSRSRAAAWWVTLSSHPTRVACAIKPVMVIMERLKLETANFTH